MTENKGSKLPAIFIGHGSPMNALADNSFTQALAKLGRELPRPRAVLCVSAHWMTEGTWVTGMERPKTIHDFYGFPQALFDVQYPAPGSLDIATEIIDQVADPKLNLDKETWGLDHGTWSILRHIYPNADVPVLQLSIYMAQPAEYHFKIGQELSKLRERGILIVGSGNIVHNLREIDWNEKAPARDWAVEFDAWSKEKLEKRDFAAFQNDFLKNHAGKMSVPSNDHYYPLLYTIGAAREDDELSFIYEGMQNATISMRSFMFA